MPIPWRSNATGRTVPDRSKPSGPVTTGFRPLSDDTRWDRQPIYRIVEIVRDGDGRLHKQWRVWHNNLDMLRRFGRAVAANTASHKVLITDSHGDVIEELSVALPEDRRSAWNSWGSVALPPAPPLPVRKARQAPKTAPPTIAIVPADTAPLAAAPEAAAAPPQDIPMLPVEEAAAAVSPLPEHETTLP